MAIYLRHELHGTHICYDEADADLHVRERGWVRIDFSEKKEAPKPKAKPGPKPKPVAPDWLGGE